MHNLSEFGFKEVITHVIGDMAKAVSVRNGETQQQKFARFQAATHMILDLRPRDVIEAMVAGHAVMFHEVLADSIRDTLQGQIDTMRRATRANIVAMDKAFGNNLDRLAHYHNRPSEGTRDAPEAKKEQPQAAEPAVEQEDQPVSSPETPAQTIQAKGVMFGIPVDFTPTPELIAMYEANPEAMAAIRAGDPERLARAMQVDIYPEEAEVAS